MLYAARFIHYAAALQLFGAAAFQCLVARAALRHQLDRPAHVLALLSAWLLLLSAAVWLAATAAAMGSGWADALNPAVVSKVLTGTAFGRQWTLQLIVSALAVAVLLRTSQGRWIAATVIAGIALGGLGLVGHATIGEDASGLVNRASQALHLLSSGFWIGSLLPLIFCLRAFGGENSQAAAAALQRFSGLGHAAVAVVIATGALNGWLLLGGADLTLSSAYQSLLFAKVAVVGLMVVLAIVNRYVFMPKIPLREGLDRLRLGTVAEIVLSGAVVGLVSVLGTMSPA